MHDKLNVVNRFIHAMAVCMVYKNIFLYINFLMFSNAFMPSLVPSCVEASAPFLTEYVALHILRLKLLYIMHAYYPYKLHITL